MNRAIVLNTLVCAMAAACGHEGGSYQGAIDDSIGEMAGRNLAVGAQQLRSLAEAPSNEVALGHSYAVFGAMEQMVLTKAFHRPAKEASMSSVAMRLALGPWNEACVSVEPKRVRYNACSTGGSTIDGTLIGSGSSVEMDLLITRGASPIAMSLELDFSPSFISGFIRYQEEGTQEGSSASIYHGKYNIDLDNNGCAVSGEIEVHHTQKSANIDLWTKAEFGPVCGNVTFY